MVDAADDASLLDPSELHLNRRFKAHGSTVSLVISTQASFDRLQALRRLLDAWDGIVCCAMLLERRDLLEESGHESNKAGMLRELQTLHSQSRGRLELHAFHRTRCHGGPYPINTLRNFSLDAAARLHSSHVWILDVDCVPCSDALSTLIGTPERLAALRRLCCEEGDALVVPCLDTLASAGTLPPFQTAAEAKTALLQGTATPFMHERWPQGHRATNFSAWAGADGAECSLFLGPLRYEEFFEPYVIVSLALCPRFDASLTGYGRNKALHALHLHRCGARFWAATSLCVVHVAHEPSRDFLAALGDGDRVGSSDGGKRPLAAAKRRYEAAAAYISRSCTAQLPPPLLAVKDDSKRSSSNRSMPSGLCCQWSPDAPRAARAAARQAMADNSDGSRALLMQLCSRWMDYSPPHATSTLVPPQPPPRSLQPLRSLQRGSYEASGEQQQQVVQQQAGQQQAGQQQADEVWLVTHLSADRLQRFAGLLDSWPGHCAAAVWVGRDSKAAAAVRSFRSTLHPNRPSSSELRLVIVSGPPPTWRAQRSRIGAAPPSTYPVNLMRGTALDAAPESAVVLVADVDARPPLALGAALCSAACGDDEWAAGMRKLVVSTCRERGRFLVLPALEQAEGAHADGEQAGRQPDSLMSLVLAATPSQAQVALARCASSLQAFHFRTCPDGHAPTRTSVWMETVLGRPYDITDTLDLLPESTRGYEPYGIVEAKRLRSLHGSSSGDVDQLGYDRRFIGWHKDRVVRVAPASRAHL